jgi:hypothetical protein
MVVHSQNQTPTKHAASEQRNIHVLAGWSIKATQQPRIPICFARCLCVFFMTGLTKLSAPHQQGRSRSPMYSPPVDLCCASCSAKKRDVFSQWICVAHFCVSLIIALSTVDLCYVLATSGSVLRPPQLLGLYFEHCSLIMSICV